MKKDFSLTAFGVYRSHQNDDEDLQVVDSDLRVFFAHSFAVVFFYEPLFGQLDQTKRNEHDHLETGGEDDQEEHVEQLVRPPSEFPGCFSSSR